MVETIRPEQVFNSAFETGIRALCALSAGCPNEYDIQQLLAFDHIIVHSSDMPGGPSSLHPQVQQRNGELLVRRPLIQKGLALMEAKGLVVTRISKAQILYASTDLAPVFLDSLANQYLRELTDRADWAVSTFSEMGPMTFFNVFSVAFDRWSMEFQIADVKLGQA
ncbi:MAG: threonine transporter [Alphaproteobacteria bacterium]|nr:threonine transporter [Alphaproteobacteria bacterium]